MKPDTQTTRRQWLASLVSSMASGAVLWAARPLRAAEEKPPAATAAPKTYDPNAHSWRMCVDVEKCIGCGLCVEACKKENRVIPKPAYFRTWVERYICSNSPCDQACPVGATFRTPDGVVVVDPTYCIGCGFCVQACPYGCRYLDPVTRTADKCTMCYHRLTRGLKTACVEVCPTGARMLGDMKDLGPSDPIRVFLQENKVQVLKPHLGTDPRLLYAGLDKEVR